MARTLLQAVNKVLRRVGEIDTDLTTFTVSANQNEIDTTIQAWNEVIDDLQSLGSWPASVGEGTITLVASTKTYAAAADFDGIADDPTGRPVMLDTTNGRYLYEFPGGWDGMRRAQLVPANHTGTPNFWAVNKTDGTIELDNAPTSADAGNVYRYIYNKQLDLAATTDTFPFLDDVIDTLIPAVVQVFRRDRKGAWERGAATAGFNTRLYNSSLSRAAKKLARFPPRRQYGPRHGASI